MKTTKFFLMLFLITVFGTADFYAQTANPATPATKTKRKYTKKTDLPAAVATPTTTDNSSTKPKRTYTKKSNTSVTPPVVATSTPSDNSSTKPKRTYTKKTDATVTPVAATSTTTDNSSTKPKRTYPKKTSGTAVTTATNTVQPTAQNAPTATPRKTAPAPAMAKQAYNPSNGGTYNGHQVLIGPKGGKYYINKNGNKTYIK
ncbi:hypothetical protein [Kaistella sp.]|uniref:hypothetical protein n=1 Tax=Kaistella sp. TaxID=2782235 RepID=UPI003C3E2D98